MREEVERPRLRKLLIKCVHYLKQTTGFHKSRLFGEVGLFFMLDANLKEVTLYIFYNDLERT